MSTLNLIVLVEPKGDAQIDAIDIAKMRREGKIFTFAASASPAFRTRFTRLYQDAVLRAK